MCGICGEVSRSLQRLPEKSSILGMAETMKHRGPDGEGFWSENGVALGHRRLTIIDLTDASSQPFVLPSENVAISYNGEIYNYVELKEELLSLGHRFKSSGDTEVILRGYLQWGTDVLSRLNG